ncbi:MAG TPA: AAA family ATPase [Burkholderiales bacterium]|nr:AAA family ATPase [Burkholderiales bacterium]
MSELRPLASESLYRRSDLRHLPFDTTDDLEALPGIFGQERAREAIDLGVGVRARGYNVFVLGPAGLGKHSLARELLEVRAAREPTPPDWCYVNNFEHPHRPRALRLPPGQGAKLRQDLRQLVEELRASIPAMFESEEYRNRAEQIDAEINERGEKIFHQLGEEAAKDNIALLHTPAGFSFAPVRDGEVISPDDYAQLPGETRSRIEAKMEELQAGLQKAARQVQQLQKERRVRLKQLNREMTLLAVGTQTEEIKSRYPELPEVLRYLDAVQADVLENIDDFRRSPETETNALGLPAGEPVSFRRYEVNVVIGDQRSTGAGAPIVYEDYPTHPNLLGRVEHVARFGMLVTDFALIKPGALHRANGGYLLLDAYKLLSQPFAWDGLKRALSTGELKTESLGQTYGLISTVALEPEPIPLEVKAVLFGERILYYLLLAFDPEFGELFKIAADFEDDVPRSRETETLLARMIATLARREKLLPFDRGAVARMIEHGARLGPDSAHLSAHLERLVNLLREAEHGVRQVGGQRVDEAAVERALDRQERRAGRVREKIREAILRGELLIDTSGATTGQVNGLSVSSGGGYSFGHPTRITATTRLGDGEVVDIQREVEMGGPIHSKGVLILSSFLAARYSGERPNSLSASLVFEQTYGEVEGDSASVAELCALLSSLAELPVQQSLAVTGSVNQHGRVQPVGGLNEKIEGFFDICSARGLTGAQGVIIPSTNVAHLMLKKHVRDAAAAGQFHIYAVDTIDQAIELLTQTPAGGRDAQGAYPDGSVNFRVAARLLEFSLIRQAYAGMTLKVKTVTKAGKKQSPPTAP